MPAMADMGEAFIHPTPHAVREYMRAALRGALGKYDRCVIPIAGRLDMAEAAVDAGWRAGEIQCADTNLFTSLLGYMAAGMDLDELGIVFEHDTVEAEWARAKFADNPAAAVFMMLKLAQLRKTDTMERLVRNELWADRDRYANQFQANAMRLAEKLRGLDYKVADVFEVASEAAPDEMAVMYLDPGREFGKPFECVGEPGAWIGWNKPAIGRFEPASGMAKLHHDLMPANALAFFHWHAKSIAPDYLPRIVYVSERGPMIREHILANRPDEARRLVKPRKETEIAAAAVPTWIGEIPRDTPITLQKSSKETALYYADLWGKKPAGRIGTPYLMLINGHMAAVIGMGFSDIRRSIGPWVHVLFTACAPGVPLELPMMAATCEDARKLFEEQADAPLYDVKVIRRIVWASKAAMDWPCAASGLELKHRLKHESDGTHELTYQGPFRGTFFSQIVNEMLDLPREKVDTFTNDSGGES